MDQNINPNAPEYSEEPTQQDSAELFAATGTKIPANSYFLLIDKTGVGTTYDNVMCLINFSFDASSAVNDDSTMCGPDNSAGVQTATIPFTGKTFIVPGTGAISAPDIFTIWQNKSTVAWKIGKATPTTGDMTKTGKGFLSAYGEAYDTNATGNFSGTINVTGPITQAIAT
jgi:hypothetical protein